MKEAKSPEILSDVSAPALKWTIAAVIIALTGVGGSVWLSVGMGLKACPLCFYQRAFVMAVAGVFLTALLSAARNSALPHVLALPAAVAGLGVAVFHVWLEVSGTLECPHGVFGLGTAPQQSLAIFVLLLIPQAIAAFRQRRSGDFGALRGSDQKLATVTPRTKSAVGHAARRLPSAIPALALRVRVAVSHA
jgi:disulfide bond formation protein DsbB